MFLYVNIDNKNYTLPEFVDRVPLIFLKNSKEVIIDQNVILFVNKLKPTVQTREHAPLESGISDMSKGISSSYSFMNENEDKITPMNYVFLNTRGDDDPSRNLVIETGDGKIKIDSASFEAYKQTRDLDDANFFPRKNV